MAKRTRRIFPENFKAEAVRLAQAGNGSIAAVARDLDVHVTTLWDWIRQAAAPALDAALLSPSEKQELLHLRREVAVLRMERARQSGLCAVRKRRFTRTTLSQHPLPIAPNLLARNFTVDAPNRVWTTDLT